MGVARVAVGGNGMATSGWKVAKLAKTAPRTVANSDMGGRKNRWRRVED